jgi:hypothetical protein
MAEHKQIPQIYRTVTLLSGIGSFVLSIMAVVGVVVYQANSNTELKTEVRQIRTEIPQIRNEIREELSLFKRELSQNRREVNEEVTVRLTAQDKRIKEMQEEINDLKVRVGILESR